MRPADKSTRFTAPLFLLPALFVAQVLFYQTAYFLRTSWREDRTAPLAVTAEWKPNKTHSPDIESGIAALSRSNPDKVPFLTSTRYPHPRSLPGADGPVRLSCWFPRLHPSHRLQHQRRCGSAATPVSLAVVLSHELTHCRLHDQVLGGTVASIWHRLLWRNEEATAHVAGLETAARLRLPLSGGPLSGWCFEYLLWDWPAATLLLSGLASLSVFTSRAARQETYC